MFTPSATALQLLRNLGVIRDNLRELGQGAIVSRLDRYIRHLQTHCQDDVEFIDYATEAMRWGYHMLAPEARRRVFRGYRPAAVTEHQPGYGPKAEIEHFCQHIEPHILALSQPDHSPAR